VHVDFALFIQDELGTRAFLQSKLVDTGANLSSERLRDILRRLGFSYARYELREKLIDAKLLAARNEIAHGQFTTMKRDDFLDLHESVEQLIADFRDDVLQGARSAAYAKR
jgi:hypothetical protein